MYEQLVCYYLCVEHLWWPNWNPLYGEYGTKLTIGVKHEVNVNKWDGGSRFSCLFYVMFSGVY
jgi:hypothetical protein